MTTKFYLLHEISVGKYYKLLTFRNGIRMTDVRKGTIDNKFINNTDTLGKLLEIRKHGRPYDPDITLYFEGPDGKPLQFDPTFGMTEAYIEYEVDTEEKSRQRIHKRTAELKLEIIGNDWALRPENVVATQGIDTKTYNTI
jgi:hypothetical protein